MYQQLNDAPILEQTDGLRDRLLLAALWKLNGGATVKLTDKDISDYLAAFNNEPVMFLHGHVDSIEVGIVTMERAKDLAAHQASLASKAQH
jgi:hypothetical protein